uniref:Rhodanese domain-containing protein n=1 Tax=Eutreptiella gymnastica TaxID=73025 RepID=A0A7S1JFQ8_9EUGL|mmetsp:Transcript_93489/g.161968  ORF Transcript_93489/g.161968 Transcript_93489/m.161968 type:complete len:355 (+) Transcript_93489:39-1103(+)
MASEHALLSTNVAYYTPQPSGSATHKPIVKMISRPIFAATIGLCAGLALTRASASTTKLVVDVPRVSSLKPAMVGGILSPLAIPVGLQSAAATSIPTDAVSVGTPSLVATLAEGAEQMQASDDTLPYRIVAAALPIILLYVYVYSGAAAAQEHGEDAQKVCPSGTYLVGDGHRPTSPEGWKIQAEALTSRGLNAGVSGKVAAELAREGRIQIVDVRTNEEFQKGHIPGSVNVPLFRRIEGWSVFKAARRFQFTLFGQVGTEFNSRFLAEWEKKVRPVSDDGSVIQWVVVDSTVMGTLEATESFPNGKPCHALMAIYLASISGYAACDMNYLKGGIDAYARDGGVIDGKIEGLLF